MTWFTIADFNKGYWMVELHPDWRKLTTIALDIGRLQWMWLPMGSIIAQDIFQRKLDSIFLDVSVSQELLMTWSFMEEMIRNTKEISLTFWKYVGTTTWPWMLRRCNSDFQKFPSLDILGVTKDCQQIQRKLKLWKEWKCLKMWKQWEVS